MARRSEPLRRARLGPVLFDLATSLFVALLALIDLLLPHGNGWLAGFGAGMAVAVLVRRRWPVAVMAVVSALGLAQVLVADPRYDPRPYDAAILIAMYSVVKYGRRLWHGLLSALVAAIGIVIEVTRHPVPTWWATALFYAAVCGAIWLGGYTVRVRRLYVAQLEERAATAERERDHLARLAAADERASIARELHDVVAHSLAVMIVQADGASYALDHDPEAARTAIRQVATTGRESLTDMRRLLGVLRGDPRNDSAAAGTPAPREPAADAAAAGGHAAASTAATVDGTGDDRRRLGTRSLQALVDRATSARLTVDLAGTGDRPADLPDVVDLAAYRIVQEGLTNALRHAGTGAVVTVRLAYAARAVRVEVTDNGGRRSPVPELPESPPAVRVAAPLPVPGGHGLIGMRERVAVFGGTFEAGPHGTGWRIAATLPWGAERASVEPVGATEPVGAAEPAAGRTVAAAEPAA